MRAFRMSRRRGATVSKALSTLTVAAVVSALLAVPAMSAPNGGSGGSAGGLDPALVRQDEGGRSTVVFGSGHYLTEPSNRPPEQVVLGFLRHHHDEFALTRQEVNTLQVTSELRTDHDGAHHLELDQVVNGIRVDGAGLVALVDAEGRLVLIGGRTGQLDTSGTTRLTAGRAIGLAAQRAGAGTDAGPEGSQTRARGRHTFPNPYARGLNDPSPVSAELVWHMAEDRSLQLAWRTEVEVSPQAWFTSLLDAESGEFLHHESLYHHAGPEGNVFTEEHPGVAGATQQIVPFTGVNGSWVDDEETSGNNVDAYRDRDDSDANDEYQPSNADQHFNFTFTDAWQDATDVADEGALDADQDPAITQLFYYTNHLHDWLWGFGFDEASGNFQVTNPSGDGVGGDPVLAEAQDGWDFGCVDDKDNDDPSDDEDIRCLNNANFGTTNTDGSTARMQMYMWVVGGDPSRDGSMDGDVVAHEYGHGVAERLLPNGLTNSVSQSGSLGEGWSDALSFLRWGDAVIGDYATSNTTTGVRSVAYDTSTRTYGSYSTSVTSPHFNGEIWATMLYDVREFLGLNTTTQLVIDGMRNTPNTPTPTFIDARDGILAADVTNNGGANQCAIWSAFAMNGLGANAVSNGLHASQTNNFDMPPECLPTADANGPYTTDEGTDVTLDGSGSAKGTDASAGAIVTYEWDLDDDGQFDDATGVAPDFTDVGQDGVFTVGLQVTDEFGNTDEDSTTVTVDNVAPTVTIDPIPAIDEHGTTTISGVVSDPGWEDVLTASIDFDDGAGPQPLAGALESVRPDATFTFSVDKQYGDDGSFEVEVVGFDDDTSSSSSATAVVANVDPTAAIDGSGKQTYDGVSAFVLEAGEDLTVPVDATDPGSDDLTATWDWGDGTTDSQTSLVNPPFADPPKSPSVQPRDVTLQATHAYADACLYDLGVEVVDDDGGSASDAAVVLVTGNAEMSRGSGWWLNQYRDKPPQQFTTAELECYLAIVNHFSLVFSEHKQAKTRSEGAEVLNSPAKAPDDVIFDQHALAAWLNFANGSVKLDTMVDTDGDGITDTTFGDAMLTAEMVRIDATSTTEEIKAQKDVVERIGTQSE